MRDRLDLGTARTAARPAQGAAAAASRHPLVQRALALQRTAGNRAVARALAGAGAPATGKLPPGVDVKDVPVTGRIADAGEEQGSYFDQAAKARAHWASLPHLEKRTEHAVTTGDCGKFSWTVQWKLDKPTKVGGWVIQKVELDRDVKKCDGTAAPVVGLDPAWYPVWEAWPIRKNCKVTKYAEHGDREDDTYGSSSQPDTKGSLKVRGRAEFYEGLTLPATFRVTNAAPTYILPATKTPPSLTGGTGAIAHDLAATWDCCTGGDKSTKVTPT